MVLLNDEKRYELRMSLTADAKIFDYEKSFCQAQLRATVEWFIEPCKEHPIKSNIFLTADQWNALTYKNNKHRYYSHRKDCPECIEALKKEAGIE